MPDFANDSPDNPISDGDLETLAVVAEVDEDSNQFISQSKKICSKDQLDYCAGSSYKGASHTMCKYCVSNLEATYVGCLSNMSKLISLKVVICVNYLVVRCNT